MSATPNESIDITFGTTFEVNGGSAFPFDTKGPFDYLLLRASDDTIHRIELQEVNGEYYLRPKRAAEA